LFGQGASDWASAGKLDVSATKNRTAADIEPRRSAAAHRVAWWVLISRDY